MDKQPPTTDGSAADGSAVDALDVYWRPGCPFCSRLFSALDRAQVTVRLHNIWEDDEARAFVRAHNNGNETVPTIQLGERVAVNPSPAGLVELLAAEFPGLVGSGRS